MVSLLYRHRLFTDAGTFALKNLHVPGNEILSLPGAKYHGTFAPESEKVVELSLTIRKTWI